MYEAFFYHPERGLKTELTPEEIAQAVSDQNSLLWLDILDIDDSVIDLLTNIFNVHPLTIEDFIMPNSRPKAEKFKDYMFLIMFALQGQNNGNHGKVKAMELDCCLGKNFLITYHSDPINPLTASKDRIRKQSPIIMQGGDMLLYSILDACVDSYFPAINDFDNLVDEMSDELFKNPDQQTLRKIYTLKNDVMNLKRTIGPQADVISLMARGDFEFILPGNLMYFRNVYDNLVRLNDVVGTSRDVITGAMEAYVSIVSNRLNEIMKTLTIMTTIMMPLTLVASIYGMNFKHMPELNSRLGYPIVIAIMVTITATMLLYFKRRRWI